MSRERFRPQLPSIVEETRANLNANARANAQPSYANQLAAARAAAEKYKEMSYNDMPSGGRRKSLRKRKSLRS